jgi:hypothetical protein
VKLSKPKLDAAPEHCPDAAQEREQLYNQLRAYVDEHGALPDDFTLEKVRG